MGERGWRMGLIALLILVALAACSPPRAGQAALMLADISAGPGASLWKRVTPGPRHVPVSYAGASGMHVATLYLPGGAEAPRAGIVLTPGVAPGGWRDPDLMAFAESLARARFAVLVPRIPGFEAMRVHVGDAREIRDALAYMRAHPAWTPSERLGIVGLSYAAGLGVLACLRTPPTQPVRFLLGIGAYYDLEQEIRFFSTGYFRVEGRWHYQTPSPYGKWVFVQSVLPFIRNPQDLFLLQRMVRRRLANPQAELAPLAIRLGQEGRAVYALLENKNPWRVSALIAALPTAIRTDLAALDLSNKNLRRLTATRFLLVHGMDDPIVPYGQSVELIHALPRTGNSLFLIHHVLGHVNLHPSRLMTRAFWLEDVPDYWRLFQVVYALLGERG